MHGNIDEKTDTHTRTHTHTQDYDSMVELAESLPDHEQIQKAPVQVQYAFALNRRNKEGDRDKALQILEKVITIHCCMW